MENATTIANIDLSPVTTALTSAITPAQIINLLASIVAFGLPFVLMWFGVRKVIKIFKSAVMKGKITV
jgi:hypothetical protein